MTYTLTQDPKVIVRDDGAFIPADPDNRDYRDYLAWLDEGNEPNPIPPDPVPPMQPVDTPDINQVNAQVQDIDERLSALENEVRARG